VREVLKCGGWFWFGGGVGVQLVKGNGLKYQALRKFARRRIRRGNAKLDLGRGASSWCFSLGQNFSTPPVKSCHFISSQQTPELWRAHRAGQIDALTPRMREMAKLEWRMSALSTATRKRKRYDESEKNLGGG
jgi:hypothetical protein